MLTARASASVSETTEPLLIEDASFFAASTLS
jgi:hypothetical protein